MSMRIRSEPGSIKLDTSRVRGPCRMYVKDRVYGLSAKRAGHKSTGKKEDP